MVITIKPSHNWIVFLLVGFMDETKEKAINKTSSQRKNQNKS